MTQLTLRSKLRPAPPFIWSKCDYCERVASLRVNGDSVVCDRCMGIVDTPESEPEMERARR